MTRGLREAALSTAEGQSLATATPDSPQRFKIADTKPSMAVTTPSTSYDRLK
jgi:hypothetical protein